MTEAKGTSSKHPISGLVRCGKTHPKSKMKTSTYILISVCLCSLLPGCKLFEDIGPTVPLAELESAPERITLENREFVLETYLLRNFMPICPPDGWGLMAFVAITATDSLEFPSHIDTDHIWIINGSRVWESNFSNDFRPPHTIYQLTKVARNGPKWGHMGGPFTFVDVIVRVVDSNNQRYLLKASHQIIDLES